MTRRSTWFATSQRKSAIDEWNGSSGACDCFRCCSSCSRSLSWWIIMMMMMVVWPHDQWLRQTFISKEPHQAEEARMAPCGDWSSCNLHQSPLRTPSDIDSDFTCILKVLICYHNVAHLLVPPMFAFLSLVYDLTRRQNTMTYEALADLYLLFLAALPEADDEGPVKARARRRSKGPQVEEGHL